MQKIVIGSLFAVGCLAFLYIMGVLFVQYGTCAYFSEDEVVEFARNHIRKEIKFLVRHFGEPAVDVEAGRFVLFSMFDDFYRYSVTYQTPRGQLLIVSISKACNVDFDFTNRVQTPMDAVFSRDLRISDPAVGR